MIIIMCLIYTAEIEGVFLQKYYKSSRNVEANFFPPFPSTTDRSEL